MWKWIRSLLLYVWIFCMASCICFFATYLFGRVGDSVCNDGVYFACIDWCPFGHALMTLMWVSLALVYRFVCWYIVLKPRLASDQACCATMRLPLKLHRWELWVNTMQQCQALALTTSIFPPADQPGNKCNCQAKRGSAANIELARWRHKTLKTTKNLDA